MCQGLAATDKLSWSLLQTPTANVVSTPGVRRTLIVNMSIVYVCRESFTPYWLNFTIWITWRFRWKYIPGEIFHELYYVMKLHVMQCWGTQIPQLLNYWPTGLCLTMLINTLNGWLVALQECNILNHTQWLSKLWGLELMHVVTKLEDWVYNKRQRRLYILTSCPNALTL